MDYLFYGALSLVLAGVLSSLLPGNRLQVSCNLVFQAIACTFVLLTVIPILAGGPAVAGVIDWSYPVGRIDIRVDGLGAMFLAFSTPFTFLGSIYAVGYLAKDMRSKRHVGIHFGLLALVQFSYLVVYTVQNAFAFLIGWEFAAIGAWLLVIWYHREQKIRFAGFNYLVSTHLSLLFLVAGIMIMHGSTESFQFSDFEKFLRQPSVARNIAFVLLMTSFGLKSAFFPFHTWLPRAHSAAPAHVSALMSGVIHKAGLFGMMKLVLMVGTPELWMGWYLLTVASVSAFMGVLYTISQRDIKRMLGYSSTENVGIAGIGIGLGCIGLSTNHPLLVGLGFCGALLHVINHALFKCLLFYAAGSLYRFTHTIDLEKLGGLHKSMRWTTPLFLLGSLAGAALPPFNGFVSEFIIYVGLIQPLPEVGVGRIVLLCTVALLAFVGGLSALSATRSFGLIFLGVPRDPHHVHPESREHPMMIIPMVIHLIGIMLIGVFPVLGIRLIEAPANLLLGLSSAPTVGLTSYVPMTLLSNLTWGAVIFLGVLAALLVLRFALLPRCDRRHVTWGCGYTAPNSRMQYTGSSFSGPMITVFQDILKFVKRENLPKGVFPKDGSLESHCVDSVENKIFSVLSEGEKVSTNVMSRIPESSSFSFLLGLITLLILVGLLATR